MRIAAAIREWCGDVAAGWNRFWFEPADPATLGLVRIFAGAMLLYTHLIWTLDLNAFFGSDSWLSRDAVGKLQADTYCFSYLWWVQDRPILLWTVHALALVVFAMLTIGLFSRVVSVLAFVAALAYVQRVPGALFGLDQINVMLAMYLAVGPCGDAFSLDRLLAARKTQGRLPVRFSWSANLTIRLIQVHMCIIYLFAGTAKLTGAAWWDGTALWMALGNLEYQSLDMTWMANWPRLINLMTHVTVYWEIFYCALIWPRLTRPVMLLLAIPLHLGIAICLGMVTFGLVMLVGNLAFVSPALVRSLLTRQATKQQKPEATANSIKLARGTTRSAAGKR